MAGSNKALVRGLTNGDTLFFSAAAVAGGLESASTGLGTAVTVGPSAATGAITGQLNLPAFTGSVAVVATNASNGKITYPALYDGPAAGWLTYRIPVPDGTYTLSVYLDVGSDGSLGPPNPSLFNRLAGVTVANGATTTAPDIDVAAETGPRASVVTNYYAEWNNVNLTFSLGADADFRVPATATVTSGPGLIAPVDMGVTSVVTGEVLGLTGWANSPAGVLPSVGDAYTIHVTYVDESTADLTAFVTGVLTSAPTPTAPVGAPAVTPTQFTWNAPSTLPAGAYSYGLGLWMDGTGSWIWGPTVNGTPPATSLNYNGPPLASFTRYGWWVSVHDAFGNSGWSKQVSFTTP